MVIRRGFEPHQLHNFQLEMSKILDSNFRGGLYQSLIDAGYEKLEAQKIIGSKYFEALKGETMGALTSLCEKVGNNEFDVAPLEKISNAMNELKKLTAILSK